MITIGMHPDFLDSSGTLDPKSRFHQFKVVVQELFRQVLRKWRERSPRLIRMNLDVERDISRSFVPIWELESGILVPVISCAPAAAGVTDD
jgi:hypothetical protein